MNGCKRMEEVIAATLLLAQSSPSVAYAGRVLRECPPQASFDAL